MNEHTYPVFCIALGHLLNCCTTADVDVAEIIPMMGGFKVTFSGYKGDAICHLGNYGNGRIRDNLYNTEYRCCWESIGFPWDHGDVSVHSANCLAEMISCLNDGIDWEPTEYEFRESRAI